ncbi:hypothetical protein Tco_1091757 [Tanacetum coccineum]|uniref:Uncharacterized protein n=1 Tax=Tanacetum coccineum TaxID=301880 RepID=A0ABQ5I949_9ASTR
MDFCCYHINELEYHTNADSVHSSSPSPVSTDHVPIDVLVEPTPGGIHAFFLDSDEDEQIGLSRVAAEPDSDDEVLAEILFALQLHPFSESASSPPRLVENRRHRKPFFLPERVATRSAIVRISPSFKRRRISSPFIPDDFHPSYCRDVVVAGSVIQTIQDGLRESYECLASAPISCWFFLDAVVPSLVSAACVAAAAYLVPVVFKSSCFREDLSRKLGFNTKSSPML